MITAINLHKSFGNIVAIDDVSFNIQKGELFGLLGPNGAGKSTSINIISGVLLPDNGELLIDGSFNPSQPDVRKTMGTAPQALAIYEELTGFENIRFFGRLYGLSGKRLRERVDWSLDFVGLSERASDRAKTYSGGMKRRLNLACAIVHEPSVLLLDEPTVGVDPQSRNMIFEKIEAIRDLGCTILYTTHYMEEAERLCNRVAIIDHGKILAIDTVENLITEHGGDSLVRIELTTPPTDHSAIPGHVEGTTVRVQSSNPVDVINKLAERQIQYKTLNIDRADLETVFLNLTGRNLRD